MSPGERPFRIGKDCASKQDAPQRIFKAYHRHGNDYYPDPPILAFFNFLAFSCVFPIFLAFSCVFPSFSKDLGGSATRETLAFLGEKSLLFPKKQGLEGQGRVSFFFIFKMVPEIGDSPKKVLSNPPEGSIEPQINIFFLYGLCIYYQPGKFFFEARKVPQKIFKACRSCPIFRPFPRCWFATQA